MHNQEPLLGGIESESAVILLHGRGGDAEEMINFAEEYLPPARFIALQADGKEWCPYSILEQTQTNEPHLLAAIDAIERAIKYSSSPLSKISLLGFSQGACLCAEFAARKPASYGSVIIFSGGLLGKKINLPVGNLKGTPIFFGCSENDPHIPLSRVKESIRAFKDSGASLTECIYPGKTHTITDKELEIVRKILTRN